MSCTPARTLSRLLACTALTTAAASSAAFVTVAASAQDAAEEEPTEVITVRGQFIPNEKRETSEISSLVDSSDFQIQGDTDAAASLRRVTGLSLSTDNKFIFARGLNERYSSATLNGSPLPSPEPLRRTVPLDIFPTSVLESALAQKTFSPEYSAEFGGAVIDLRTKSVPDERFIELGVSAGGNDTTFLRDALLYDGGGENDYTGWDDGTRNIPSSLASTFGVTRVQNADNRAEIADDLADPSLWVVQRGDTPGAGGVKFSAGDRYDFSNALSMGVLLSGSYNSDWTTREGERIVIPITVQPGAGTPSGNAWNRFSTQQTIDSSGLAQVGFDILDNHELTFLALGVRSTEKETRRLTGVSEEGAQEQRDFTEWFERQVWTTQARGEHYFPQLGDLEVTWRGSYSEALRDAPFQTETHYEIEDDGSIGINPRNSVRLQFTDVEDDTTDLGVNLSWPFTFGGMDVELKGGYAYTEKDRFALTRLYRFNVTAQNDALHRRIDTAIGLAGEPGSGVTINEIGSNASPEQYVATLEVDAYYLGLDAEVTPNLRFALGARYEDSLEAIQTDGALGEDPSDAPANLVLGRRNCYSQQSPDRIRFTCGIEKDPVLPAATLTWTFADDLQLRLAYSQTLVRPQFRELAPSFFVNTETDEIFAGNPFLQNTSIDNYDARLEYYFGRDQFFTIGGFFKELENPIEETIEARGGNVLTTTFLNSPSAEIYGGEFEFEKVFDVSDRFENFHPLNSKDLFVDLNYTYSQSEVSASGSVVVNGAQLSQTPEPVAFPASEVLIDGRPLQGQSEHLFNMRVGYDDHRAQSRLALLLNYASERIRAAEHLQNNAITPAVFEEPPLSLDLTYSRLWDVRGGEIEFGFKAQNILGDDYEAYQTADGQRFTFDTYDVGRSYSVSLTARY